MTQLFSKEFFRSIDFSPSVTTGNTPPRDPDDDEDDENDGEEEEDSTDPVEPPIVREPNED
jgi:hypothetical protein